jgi:hypothetical protein
MAEERHISELKRALPPADRQADAQHVIALVNTSEDMLEVMELAMRLEGFDDLAIPYDLNWQFLRSQIDAGLFEGRALLLTTTNEAALRQISGGVPQVTELFGKPYDLAQLTRAVRRALAT